MLNGIVHVMRNHQRCQSVLSDDPVGCFQNLRRRFRIKRRRMLIENPHYSNEAISSECGFSSHAHLYKVFRAKTGMTPRMYRESLAG